MKKISAMAVCAIVAFILCACCSKASAGPVIGSVVEQGLDNEALGITKDQYKVGRGVEGALVVIEGTKLQSYSNYHGWFWFTDLPDGVYNIAAIKEGYHPVIKQVRVEGRGTAEVVIVLTRKKTPGSIFQNTGSSRVTIPNEVYVAFAAIAAPGSSAANPGSYPVPGSNMTTLQYKSALAAGADPNSLTGFPAPQMPQGGFCPTSPNDFMSEVNYYPNSLSIFDPNAPKDVRFINLNLKPYWLCFDGSGSKVFVSSDNGYITVVDLTMGNKAIGSIPTGGIVTDMTRGPDGNVYVAVSSTNPGILVLSPNTNTASSFIRVKGARLGADAQPRGVAVGSNFVYVTMANQSQGEVIAVNRAGGALAGSCTVGAFPQGVTLLPNGQFLFVANYNEGTVSVIRAADMAHLGKIRVGAQPIKIICNSRGDRVYVTNYGSNYVTAIDGRNGAVIATIPTGSRPMGIGINSAGTRVFVANNGDGTVTIINAETNTPIQTTTASTTSKPFGISVRP